MNIDQQITDVIKNQTIFSANESNKTPKNAMITEILMINSCLEKILDRGHLKIK